MEECQRCKEVDEDRRTLWVKLQKRGKYELGADISLINQLNYCEYECCHEVNPTYLPLPGVALGGAYLRCKKCGEFYK